MMTLRHVPNQGARSLAVVVSCLLVVAIMGSLLLTPILLSATVSALSQTLTQYDYQWYPNTFNPFPTDALADEHTPIVENNWGLSFRLRLNVQVENVALGSGTQSFKLQYAASTSGPWSDVGGSGSGSVWRGYDNQGEPDGALLAQKLLTTSDVLESYEEENPSVANPGSIPAGQRGEWEWVVEDNGATRGATYYFRVVKADSTPLDVYTNYPQITIPELVVTGQWLYLDIGGSSYVPARRALVQVRDSYQNILGSAMTNTDGSFYVGVADNPYPTSAQVRISTYSEFVPAYVKVVRASSGATYAWYSGSFATQGSTYDIGTNQVPLDLGDYRAWWILNFMRQGYERLKPLGVAYRPERVLANWPGSGSFYNPWSNEITYTELVAGDQDVVLHEMGHALHDNIDPNFEVYQFPPGHSVPYRSDPLTAWYEGWADFWPIVVKNNPNFMGENLELQTWGQQGWDDGDEVEGRVAGGMWDVFDADTDGWDLYDGGDARFMRIWDTMYLQHYGRFSEFWDQWKSNYPGAEHRNKAARAVYQSTIDYGLYLKAATSLEQEVYAGFNKLVRVAVNIVSVKDKDDDSLFYPVPGGIKSYDARVTYPTPPPTGTPQPLQILSVSGGESPFANPVVNIDDANGTTSHSDQVSPGEQPQDPQPNPYAQPPDLLNVAKLVPRLAGAATESVGMSSIFDAIAVAGGGTIDQEATVVTIHGVINSCA